MYFFDGITPDTQIVHCTVFHDNYLDKLVYNKYIVIKKFRISLSPSSSDAYVILQDGMIFETSPFQTDIDIDWSFTRVPAVSIPDILHKEAGMHLSMSGKVI